MATLRGTWYIVPTAFDADGALDLESQRRLIDAAIRWGVDGLTVLGVMGEANALSADARRAVLGAVREAAAGRVPVAVGCTASSVHGVIGLAREAREFSAVAAMVSPPTLMSNIDLLPDFYARVAKEGGLPLIIQDHPASSGVSMPASVILRCAEASGATVIKLEDPPTPPKITRLLNANPNLLVFGGLGGVSALGEMRRGGCGTMTGFAFPEILKAVREAIEAGDTRAAGLIFDRYLPLIQFEGQAVVGLAIRKEVLRRRGALAHNTTRGFSPRIDPITNAELDETLARVGIIPSIEPFAVPQPASI
jgi:4-hydroxy-tetrahydrodipicolinate synthase